jgi:hypothetical protein
MARAEADREFALSALASEQLKIGARLNGHHSECWKEAERLAESAILWNMRRERLVDGG